MSQATTATDRDHPAPGGGARPSADRRPRRQGRKPGSEPGGDDEPKELVRRRFFNLFGDSGLAVLCRDETTGGGTSRRAKFVTL